MLEKPFPAEQIKQRAGSFGKSLDYIEGHAVIQRLNDAFDGQWSFEIVSHEVLESEVIVRGKLTAEGISKVQFGSSQVTRHKETKEVISLADDLKAAATDALKKAATLFGVGLHLYAGKAVGSDANNSAQPRADMKLVDTGSNGNGNGSGRLSQKQHTFLLSLAGERRMSRQDLNQMSLERYGVNLEFLSKADASAFIGEIMAIAA
jgi:hypothetical protein